MNACSGGCHCGAVRLQLTLPGAPGDYAPRACDCSFCHKHGAAFVSDPAGALRIEAGRAADLVHYRQGSGQAECLCCAHCGVFVAVVGRLDGRLYGIANVRAIQVSRPALPSRRACSAPRTNGGAGRRIGVVR